MIYFGFTGIVRNVISMGFGFLMGIILCSTGIVHAGVFVTDVPDAIICRDSTADDYRVLYLVYAPADSLYRYATENGAADAAWVDFTLAGAWSADDSAFNTEPGRCQTKTFTDLYNDGQAFDFASSAGGETSSTTATSTQVINNPTLDMFMGILLFFGVFWFLVWFFRRPYDTY